MLSAEEPERELRRRLWLHGQRDGFCTADLNDLHLWFPDDVAGAVFAVPDRSGVMHPTPLFCSIETTISAQMRSPMMKRSINSRCRSIRMASRFCCGFNRWRLTCGVSFPP